MGAPPDDVEEGTEGRKEVAVWSDLASSRVAMVSCPTPSRMRGANPCSSEMALTSLAKRITVCEKALSATARSQRKFRARLTCTNA